MTISSNFEKTIYHNKNSNDNTDNNAASNSDSYKYLHLILVGYRERLMLNYIKYNQKYYNQML